jgi:hypothetical protein
MNKYVGDGRIGGRHGQSGCPCRLLAARIALALVALAVPKGALGQETKRPASAATSEAGSSPTRTRLSDSVELDQLVELYMAGEYDRCTSELAVLLDPKGPSPFRDAGAIERGRLYYASCALLAGNRESARMALRAALVANPLMSAPDSLTFPPPVVSLFLEVRDEVEALIAKREQEQLVELRRQAEEAAAAQRKKIEQEELLYKLASEETVIARQSRVIAMLPFGAGQFQNGDETLGAVFAVSEVLVGATLITAAALHADAYKNAVLYHEANQSVPDNVRVNYEAMATLAVAATFTLVGVTALGIVEANLKFKRERVLEVRPRPLPPGLDPPRSRTAPTARGPRFLPTFAVTGQGASVGLRGSF